MTYLDSKKVVRRLTQKDIRDSLMQQLKLQHKTSKFYEDLVNDYMYYYKLKKDLIKDIKENGIRYKTVNGNGIETDKANESVINLQKTTTIMLKILSDLHLKEPVEDNTVVDDYL